MLKRFLLRSLVLAGILLACFAHLVWNGWHAREITGENLPEPRPSTGLRDIDLWRPSFSYGCVYDLIFGRTGGGLKSVRPGAHLNIQIVSNGKTRLLVVRKGHPNTSVSWGDLILGRERLQIVADRGWVDLGPLPEGEERFEYQITGLLPGPFGFAEPHRLAHDHFSGFRVRRPDSPLATTVGGILRYRFISDEPVAAAETLTRFFFFLSCSWVLQATAVAALSLLFAGWFWLFEKRFARAVGCLIPAVTLLHACCLAPFRGEDGMSHAGTIEAVLWNPEMFANSSSYPASLFLLYDVIEYDRWAGQSDRPVSIDSPERRASVRNVAGDRWQAEATEAVTHPPDASLINPKTRAPLYYNAFRIAGPALRGMSVLDRIEAYVVLSACASLLFFGLGLVVLVRGGLGERMVLLYGLVALVPYSVGIVASCSNYSPAIGIGAFLAACVLTAILTEERRWRLRAALAFIVASTAGIGIWEDFVFFAVPALVVFVGFGVAMAWRLPPGRTRILSMSVVTGAGFLLTALLAYELATGQLRVLFSNFGARLPAELGGPNDPTFWVLLGTAATPFVFALLLSLFLEHGRVLTEAQRLRWAWLRILSAAALFIALFLATRYTQVPFETTRLDLFDEVAAHWSSFWSNNFSWDQDRLPWKMYWGVFGYADVSYPPSIYALARWMCVAIFVCLPILSTRFTTLRPRASALLLVFSGYALSVCVVTNGLRYLGPSNPWGRFILPLLPLAALSALARTDAPGRERAWRVAIFAAVALHVWTAVTLLGSRFSVGI